MYFFLLNIGDFPTSMEKQNCSPQVLPFVTLFGGFNSPLSGVQGDLHLGDHFRSFGSFAGMDVFTWLKALEF